jgi:hypothetical protein
VALDGLLDFALATDGTLAVLYNGPKSGASAPDHLHLQAVQSRVLPEEIHAVRHLEQGHLPGESLVENQRIRVWSDTTSGRWILGFVGERDAVGAAARIAIDALHVGQSDPELHEPQLNLVATASLSGQVILLLFPRAAHRPACYFEEGPDQLIVSPGAIDQAGVVVTVRREDFLRLRPEDAVQIFSEVSRTASPAWIRLELQRRLASG